MILAEHLYASSDLLAQRLLRLPELLELLVVCRRVGLVLGLLRCELLVDLVQRLLRRRQLGLALRQLHREVEVVLAVLQAVLATMI